MARCVRCYRTCPRLVPDHSRLTLTNTLLVGIGVYLLWIVCVPIVSYRYALRRYQQYVLE